MCVKRRGRGKECIFRFWVDSTHNFLIAKYSLLFAKVLTFFHSASFLRNFWIDEALRFAGYTLKG
jgi:hypothetical protein